MHAVVDELFDGTDYAESYAAAIYEEMKGYFPAGKASRVDQQ